jgi:hypothetical protein
MGDRKITLFELHFDGPLSLGPSFGSDDGEIEGNTEDSGGRDFETDAVRDAEGDSHDDGGVPVKGALLGLLAIAALAAAARVLLGGDDGDEPVDDGPEMVSIDEATDDA